MSINFKSGGHIIVVVGYTQCGFIVHDPYGNLNKGRDDSYGFDSDGAYVEYPYNKWSIGEKCIRYFSTSLSNLYYKQVNRSKLFFFYRRCNSLY